MKYKISNIDDLVIVDLDILFWYWVSILIKCIYILYTWVKYFCQ